MNTLDETRETLKFITGRLATHNKIPLYLYEELRDKIDTVDITVYTLYGRLDKLGDELRDKTHELEKVEKEMGAIITQFNTIMTEYRELREGIITGIRKRRK